MVIATGPLSSPAMTELIQKLTGSKQLSFYDAAAPIVTGDSVDYDQGFWGARYNKGTADYFNCPMSKEEYEHFWHELVNAEQAPLHEGVEDLQVFEGCIPIEIMARRGIETLRYGPLRPVGLADKDGSRLYAVVQLRLENTAKTLFNLVGFQTRLKGRAETSFRLIPALKNAEFVRYGVMHRNTCQRTEDFRAHLSAAFPSADIPGWSNYRCRRICGKCFIRSNRGNQRCPFSKRSASIAFPEETMIGALAKYITTAGEDFQPMNANFGILPPLEEKAKQACPQAGLCRPRSGLFYRG